jgi:hypothetical protein
MKGGKQRPQFVLKPAMSIYHALTYSLTSISPTIRTSCVATISFLFTEFCVLLLPFTVFYTNFTARVGGRKRLVVVVELLWRERAEETSLASSMPTSSTQSSRSMR